MGRTERQGTKIERKHAARRDARAGERGFLMASVALPLLAVLFALVGFLFVTELRLLIVTRADYELRREVCGGLRVMLADAQEATGARIRASGAAGSVELYKAAGDYAGRKVVMYRVLEKNHLRRLTQGTGSPQPLTGESLLGQVEIEALDAEMTESGCLHLRLAGRSRLTGHRYEQAAAVPLAELP